MLKAVAFDLDDTLLSINLSAFVAILMKDEAALLADIGRRNSLAMLAVWGGAMLDLNNNTRPATDNRTNQAFFNERIEARSGVPLDDPVIADAFTCYEREVLPRRNDGIVAARPATGAHEAIEAVLGRGLRVVLLTNPTFSAACVETRLAWGALTDVPFELVTTWDVSTRVKPSPVYYLESLERLGLEPTEVLMVGNDPKRDFPTPDCGIQTAYVGGGSPVRATWTGSMADFAASFDEIEERFYARQERDLAAVAQGLATPQRAQ